MHPDTRLKQEEERRKREELERIVEENNKKIEEAQRKLVGFIQKQIEITNLQNINMHFCHTILGGGTFGHGGAIEKNGRGSTEDATRARETDARRAIFDFGEKERSTQIIFFT
jgi:hypothetical protein